MGKSDKRDVSRKSPRRKPAGDAVAPTSVKETIDTIIGADPRGDHPSVKRSSKWPKVMHDHLAKEPCCQVCGHTKGLNVHHKKPYHLFAELELVDSNLITLCTNMKGGHDCHLLVGHLRNFKAFNPLVDADAAIWRFKIQTAAVVLKLIHAKPRSRKVAA